jgi:alkyl hydroperoxide reductase subunit AhpF
MDKQSRQEDESWDQLPNFLGHLPEAVQLHVWVDAAGSTEEREAVRLVQELADEFDSISVQFLPPRESYRFYPVIGIMGQESGEPVDYGLRIIGLPSGYQMTSLIAALQSAAFKGMTSEAATRIKLARLDREITLELITDDDDEGGPLMAQRIFNMAVISPFIRSYLIMGNYFPEAFIRYSVNFVPHLVINERIHVSGVIEEKRILQEIARALKS